MPKQSKGCCQHHIADEFEDAANIAMDETNASSKELETIALNLGATINREAPEHAVLYTFPDGSTAVDDEDGISTYCPQH